MFFDAQKNETTKLASFQSSAAGVVALLRSIKTHFTHNLQTVHFIVRLSGFSIVSNLNKQILHYEADLFIFYSDCDVREAFFIVLQSCPS